MRTIPVALALALVACGGTEIAEQQQQQQQQAGVSGVSGTYTLNRYLFFPFDASQVGQTGQMTITQSGNVLSASATTRYPDPFPPSLEGVREYNRCKQLSCSAGPPVTCDCVGHDIANDVETHQWTGTVQPGPNGSTVIRLAEPSTILPDGRSTIATFTARIDSAGNLHGDCETGIEQIQFLARCDALR